MYLFSIRSQMRFGRDKVIKTEVRCTYIFAENFTKAHVVTRSYDLNKCTRDSESDLF
jgi:hypothetical protein